MECVFLETHNGKVGPSQILPFDQQDSVE